MWDWEFEKKKDSYFFLKAGPIEKLLEIWETSIFRIAKQEDMEMIKQHGGDFFDNLKKRINEETIYILFDKDILLDCGIISMEDYLKNIEVLV